MIPMWKSPVVAESMCKSGTIYIKVSKYPPPKRLQLGISECVDQINRDEVGCKQHNSTAVTRSRVGAVRVQIRSVIHLKRKQSKCCTPLHVALVRFIHPIKTNFFHSICTSLRLRCSQARQNQRPEGIGSPMSNRT